MSRYTLSVEDEREIVVGWDPPLGTFFAQIFGPDDEDGEENLVASIGQMPREVTTLEEIDEWVVRTTGHAIPSGVCEMLDADEKAPWEPGPLQRMFGFTGKNA